MSPLNQLVQSDPQVLPLSTGKVACLPATMGKVPLKTVLKQFLEHYHKLEASAQAKVAAIQEAKESGNKSPPPLSLYEQEYIKLKELTESLKSDLNYPMKEGQSDVNRKKNRYKDILPYDKSRVILSEYPGVPGSDYINANYVRGSSGNQRAYIASQGPLPNTLVDFWRMIWETDVLVIVMACNEREAGKYKCEPYWPLNPEEKQQYGNITVEHVTWRQVCPDFLLRTFRVFTDQEERTICQFHYTTWPDHGVPVSVHPILELVRLMRDVQSSESRPILVHCSAGCGRTGTICSIDYVWALLRTGKLKPDFSLFNIISDMRRQRTSMVQTVEQYILCYKAVSTLFEQHLKMIDTHTYENIDGDGEPLGIKNLIEDANSSGRTSSSEGNTSEESNNQPLSTSNQSNDTKLEITPQDASPDRLVEHREVQKQPEKIVGMATVIRRPSIAKLKAIFDCPSGDSSSNSLDMHRPSTMTHRAKLQRSQSIKENIRSISNVNFNIHLELSQLNQPTSQNRKSKSYTLNSAKLRDRRHLSIGNLTFPSESLEEFADDSVRRCEMSSNHTHSATQQASSFVRSRNTEHTMSAAAAVSDNISTNRTSLANECNLARSKHLSKMLATSQSEHESLNHTKNTYSFPATSRSYHETDSSSSSLQMQQLAPRRPQPSSVTLQQMNSRASPDDVPSPNAPPKPPRTYQHVMDDSCIVRTSEGRLIVTIAQPRQTNVEATIVPVNSSAAYNEYNSKGPIYETLGVRKYNISSPNLLLPEQMTYLPSSAESASHQVPVQTSQSSKSRFVEPSSGPSNNTLYGNSIASKSFPRSIISMGCSSQNVSRTPMPSGNYPFVGNSHQYPLDLFGNQHFQFHQAKPIIFQQNFFGNEPIYGATTRTPFLPPRPSNLVHPVQGGNRPPPGLPARPRSISQGAFKHAQPVRNYESIYSNREVCFQMAQNSGKTFDGLALNGSTMVNLGPVPISAAKENVYAEIATVANQPATTTMNHSVEANINGKSVNDNRANAITGKETPDKQSALSKIRNVLKVFRLKSYNTKPVNSADGSSSTEAYKANHTDNNASFKNVSVNVNNKMVVNGPVASAVNPLTGQPLSRPPHSHRFQTQWTQV